MCDLASSIGHDLKTPLSAMHLSLQSWLRSLQRGDARALDPGPAADRLRALVRQVERVARHVDHLTDASRIHMGRLHLESMTVDLSSLVSRVARHFEGAAAAEGCSLRVHTEDSLHGFWDPDRLQQAIEALVLGAIERSAGEPIEIRVRAGSDHALLTLDAGGRGLSEDEIAAALGSLERLTARRCTAGAGLELWVVRRLVEAHGGWLDIDASPEGGVRMTIALPFDAGPRGAA